MGSGKLRIAVAALLLAVLGLALHYALPQVDVVRAVGGEVRRVDGDTATDRTRSTRDVYFVQTKTLDGAPSVYRNEDAWAYGKFDSADLQASVLALSDGQQTMAVRHYGWRIPFLSVFPNAIKVWAVDDDYVHIPYFNIAVLLLLALAAFFVVRRIRSASRLRAERRAAEAARAERAAQEEARLRETQRVEERRDVDAFLNEPGSGT